MGNLRKISELLFNFTYNLFDGENSDLPGYASYVASLPAGAGVYEESVEIPYIGPGSVVSWEIDHTGSVMDKAQKAERTLFGTCTVSKLIVMIYRYLLVYFEADYLMSLRYSEVIASDHADPEKEKSTFHTSHQDGLFSKDDTLWYEETSSDFLMTDSGSSSRSINMTGLTRAISTSFPKLARKIFSQVVIQRIRNYRSYINKITISPSLLSIPYLVNKIRGPSSKGINYLFVSCPLSYETAYESNRYGSIRTCRIKSLQGPAR